MEGTQKDCSLSDSVHLFSDFEEDSDSDLQFGSGTESEMAEYSLLQKTPVFTYINDPVHGMLEIHPLCMAIVDTPEFQRLRFLKQCGVCNFIYPGAMHTRFDHSLGVCYLALQVIKKLKDLKQDISEEESLCVQIAGLCHDLGHGPFSHFWEYFLHKQKKEFKHEHMSVKIFDYLIKNNNLESKFQSYSLYEEHCNFIKDLIRGEQKNPSDPKSYLFEIIANKKSGLDIDKYDYLVRDSYFFGIKVDADFHRYLMCLVVWEDENKIKHLAFRDKSKSDIENIFHERLKMHYIAYQHRVCIAINAMLVDALQAADEHYKVQGSDRKYKLSECHEDEEAMLKLTDSILENLYFSSDSNLAKAKKVILRIYKRQLYEPCGKVKVHGPLSTGEQKDLLNELSEIEKNISKTFNVTFRCCLKKLDLGQTNNTRPVDNIIFMSKSGKRSDQTLITEGIDLSPKQPGPLVIGLIDMKTVTDRSKFKEIKTVFETTIKKFNL